jgi:hypothetical protein
MKLLKLIAGSAITPDFRDGIDAFLKSGRANDQVAFNSSAPPVKVARTLTRVLESYGHLPLESVAITGRSGCEFFRGEVTVRSRYDERRVEFHWDCRWKAIELGWFDYFGFPDQIRAARELDHDCFRSWEERHSTLSDEEGSPADSVATPEPTT